MATRIRINTWWITNDSERLVPPAQSVALASKSLVVLPLHTHESDRFSEASGTNLRFLVLQRTSEEDRV